MLADKNLDIDSTGVMRSLARDHLGDLFVSVVLWLTMGDIIILVFFRYHCDISTY